MKRGQIRRKSWGFLNGKKERVQSHLSALCALTGENAGLHALGHVPLRKVYKTKHLARGAKIRVSPKRAPGVKLSQQEAMHFPK